MEIHKKKIEIDPQDSVFGHDELKHYCNLFNLDISKHINSRNIRKITVEATIEYEEYR